MTERSKSFHSLALALAAVVIASCSDEGIEDETGAAPVGTAEQHLETVYAHELRWPTRSRTEQLDRTALAFELFVGRPLTTSERGAIDAGIAGDAWARPILEQPQLAFRYFRDVDELRIADVDYESAQGPTTTDVGAVAARTEMQRHFAALGSRGLINTTHYDVNSARLAQSTSETGNTDGTNLTTWVDEYRFMMMRKLNGFDVVNNFVHIGISRAGRLVRLRFGGVDINSSGTPITRSVSDATLATQFGRETVGASQVEVYRNQTMYVLPPGASGGVVEPTRVYSYSLRFGVSVSRRKFIGYSLTRADTKIDHTPPTDNIPSDPR